MARSPTGRASLYGPQVWDEHGRFLVRRPFRLDGVQREAGEALTFADTGGTALMRKLMGSGHVACIPAGHDIPDALRPTPIPAPAPAPAPSSAPRLATPRHAPSSR